MRKIIVSLLLSAFATCAQSETNQELRHYLYKQRIDEAENTSGLNFEKSQDTKQIVKEWHANQARAQLKYSKPGLYYGKLSRIVLVNGNANFILNAGTPEEVVIILFDYQLGPWKKVDKKWKPVGFQSTMEFAAEYNAGRDFYFQCRRIEFIFKPYLKSCIAVPMDVAKES